jgi:hypothetical protein
MNGMTGGDGTEELDDWLDCECPECGRWFPLGERRCPSCGAVSTCTGGDDNAVDKVPDEPTDRMVADGDVWVEIEDVREEEPRRPTETKSSIGRKLRSLFLR